MKNYSINAFRLLMLVTVFVTLANIDAYALGTTTGKTVWVFGTSASTSSRPSGFGDDFTVVPITTITYGTTFSGVTTLEMAENESNTTDPKMNADCMHHRRGIKIQPNSAGTLYVHIVGSNQSGDSGSTRTLRIWNGNDKVKETGITASAAPISQFFEDTPGVITIDTEKYGWYNVYYIAWEPETREKVTLDLTLNGSTELDLNGSASRYISVSAKNSSNASISLDNSTYVWSASDPSVFEFDGWGSVTAKKVTTSPVTVTVSYPGNATYRPATASIDLTVINTGKQDLPSMTAKLGNNSLYVGATTTATTTMPTGLESLASSVTYTSSNTSVATVSGNVITAVGPGETTIIATFPGNDSYYSKQVRMTLTVTALPTEAWTLRKTEIRAVGNQPLSTLSGTALGLTTTASDVIDIANFVTTYAGDAVVRPNGNQVTTTSTPQYINIVDPGQTSHYNLNGKAATTEAHLEISFLPWDNYAGNNGINIDDFRHITGSASRNGRVVTLPTGSDRIGRQFSNKDLWYVENNETHFLKYFYVVLAAPTTAPLQIAAEYQGGSYNWTDVPVGSKYLYVALNPSKKLTLINIGTPDGTTTSTTIELQSAGFSTVDLTPAYGEISDIEITGITQLYQRNKVVYTNNKSQLYPESEAWPFSGSLRETIDGREYYLVPWTRKVTVVPIFSTDPTFTDDSQIVTGLGYDASGGYFQDSEGNTIIPFEVGKNSTNMGDVFPVNPPLLDIGSVSISLKRAHYADYTKTSQRTYIKIIAAPVIIRTPQGPNVPINDVYNNYQLGLHTRNTVDLNGKFVIYDENGENVTDKGTFTYTLDTGSPLTLTDGHILSCSTPTPEGNDGATIHITWTPKTEYATLYNEVSGDLFKVKVEDKSAGYVLNVNPTDITMVEADSEAITSLLTSIVALDPENNDVTASGTLSYSVSSTTYINVSGSNLEAKKYTGSTPATLTVTWTNNDDAAVTASATVKVKVLKRVRAVMSLSPATVEQGKTATLTVTFFNDINNNGVKDTGEEDMTDVMYSLSTSEFPAADSEKTYIAGIDVEDNKDGTAVVTALNPGGGPNIATGKAKITVSVPEGSSYSTASSSVDITVNDNTCFDYMGWDLRGGHTGDLYDNTTKKTYLHWRFAAEEGVGYYVYRFNSPKYNFSEEGLQLKRVDSKGNPIKFHKSEKPFDPFYKTLLTDTKRTFTSDGAQKDAKGDAFLEYNGMIAGYGTEKGGRYMTPISGTFVRIEAEYDGVVTVRLRHNGSLDTSNYSETDEKYTEGETEKTRKKYTKITQARRALFVVDENGVVMKRTSNYATLDQTPLDITNENSEAYRAELMKIDGTYARIGEESAISSTFDIVNDAYTAYFNGETFTDGVYFNETTNKKYSIGNGDNNDFSKNAFHFCRSVIYGYPDSKAAEFNTKYRLGEPQKLWYSESEDHVKYKANVPGITVNDTTYFFSKYGYEVLGATHMIVSFPVKAGKTYFVGANKSKIGLCSVEFMPDVNYGTSTNPVVEVTLDEEETLDEALSASGTNHWLIDTEDGTHLKVTLNRAFTANHWHPLVLPFSVSESQLKEVFGDNVSVIALDGALKMMSSMNNYATRDGDFWDTTTPVSGAVAPDGTTMAFNGHVIKPQAIQQSSVTFTRHHYQMIYANCPVFLWTDQDIAKGDAVFDNVTFQKYTLDKRDKENTPAINPQTLMVTFPYFVDRQIGDGGDYDYVMRASYVSGTPSNQIYYVTNKGGKAYLYHAKAGEAPTMKGTRVWIEPASGRSLPLRTIRMNHFWGDEYYVSGETSAIDDIIAEQPNEVQANDDNVYDIMGRIVGRGSLEGLTPGIYIYKGQKHAVK